MSDKPSEKPLKNHRDYYFEKGLMVMTKEYLLNRGYCCGNKCRHCPYGHINVNSKEHK